MSTLNESVHTMRLMRIGNNTDTEPNVSPCLDLPNEDIVHVQRLTFNTFRHFDSASVQTQSSQSVSTTQRLQPDIVLSTGAKYVITFRGSAQFFAHNNFQFYTANETMNLTAVSSLVERILLDPSNCSLFFYSSTCPSITTALQNPGLTLPELSCICLSLDNKAFNIDVLRSDRSQLPAGWFTVERVGDPPSLAQQNSTAYYYTHSWYQVIQTIGIPPRLPVQNVSSHSYYRVTFARNTPIRVQDQIQHFSSTATIYDIQTWLGEFLGTIHDAPMVYPETQLHFLINDPVLATTNLSQLVPIAGDVSLHVLSKSPLIRTDASNDIRIFFGQYNILHCTDFLNGREQVSLFDRREQDVPIPVRILQDDISTTVPFRLRTPGFDADRPNFHAYVIRFCTVLPESPSSTQRYSGFEYLEFDNNRGRRHIRWFPTYWR
jgi:hypothetical protein